MDLKRVNYLLSEINAVYREASSALGISDSVMQILYTICNYGDSCLLGDILRMTGLPKQTVNSALRKLEGEGIVYLRSAEKKKKSVHLTEQGKSLASATVLRLMEMENAVFDSWTAEERQSYLRLNQKYLTQFREKTKELKNEHTAV